MGTDYLLRSLEALLIGLLLCAVFIGDLETSRKRKIWNKVVLGYMIAITFVVFMISN